MNVLFLCGANIFRSQMAEGFFNTYTKNSRADSAALLAPQEKMHALVVRAMKEKGIDISHQYSKKVTQNMIQTADKVIVMHPNLLLYYQGKTPEVWNITDIVAKETDEHLYPQFQKARNKIETKVKELINSI